MKIKDIFILLRLVLFSGKPVALFFFGTVLCFALLYACDDFFEKDLADKRIVLIAPGDMIETKISTQTFYWQELNGSALYNLMVVTPSFAHIEQIVADTNVTVPRFILNLTPGKYQWRVIAKNGSSRTDSFSIWTITILSTNDISKERVDLSSPIAGYATNKSTLTFKWNSLYNATRYNLQIGETDLTSGNVLVDTTVTSANFVVNKTFTDGNYVWGVRALNDSTQTHTAFTVLNFTIDTKPPAKPTPGSPVNTTINTHDVNFSWASSKSDGGSKLVDSIFVSSDSASVANVSKITGYLMDSIGYKKINLSTDATYFWRVRTSDAAGNLGTGSDLKKFQVKVTNP